MVMLDSLEQLGGAETLALELVKRLDPDRFTRELCLTRWSDEVAAAQPASDALEELAEAGVSLIRVKRTSRASVRPWLGLLHRMGRRRPDVIHAHKFGSNAWAVLFGRLAGVKAIVAHEHMWSYEASGPLRHFIDREWIGRGADTVIAVSEEGRRQMIELEGVRPRDVRYIRNGVPELPAGDGAAVRAELGIGENEPVIVSVGRLSPEKALDQLIEAGTLVGGREPAPRILIAGEGTERGALEHLIAKREVEDRVTLLGYRTDVADLLACADVAVCCSRFEGGPLSVVQYMEAGLPVVATRVGGIPEMVLDGETGMLIPPGDPRTLAAAVGVLLDDPVLRAELGERGRQWRRDEYGIDSWVARMEALYDELLEP